MMVGVISSVAASMSPRFSISVAVLGSETVVMTIFSSLGLGPK